MKTNQIIRTIGFVILLILTGCTEPDRPTIGLYPALQRGDIDQIERHIYWGTDINQQDPEGHMPLHVAAKAGRWVVVELLLKHGAKVNIQDHQGRTPVYEALMAGRTQVAQLLIKHGASFDANQLLQEVVRNKVTDRDVVELLVKKGADINHPDENGNTPLHLAVKQDLLRLSKLLIAHGADVNSKDPMGHTPLWHAQAQQNEDIGRLLLLNGAVTE
jgi:ankyrin repeat protein